MKDIDLKTRYFSQRDSKTPQAHRMCFSSTCAMLVTQATPGKLAGANDDDFYLKVLNERYGDTTNSAMQIQCLRDAFGIKTATFRTNLDWPDIDRQLEAGKFVPIGILHHGPARAPVGGGHWLGIRGRITKNGKLFYIVNDPYGDLDLVNGGYPGSTNGNGLHYSKENLDLRWRVRQGGKPTGGWGIIY